MKQGRTINELAQEIHRQAVAKRDFLVPTNVLEFESNGKSEFHIPDTGTFDINDLGHEQLAGYLRVPKQYYDRMRENAPKLLEKNVNHWLQHDPKPRLVRTLDGVTRAFLSDKYRPLDNIELAESVLPVLGAMKLDIVSCEVTETRLYIKAVCRSIRKDIPTGARMGSGDTVFHTLAPSVCISNSEVGCGSLSVETGILTEQCTNLAYFKDERMRKYHVGRQHSAGEIGYELFSDETRKASDAATFMQVRDVVKNAFEEARFEARVKKLTNATEDKIEGKIEKAVEVTAKHYRLVESEQDSVLRHLIEGGDLTRYGLHSAITRTAEDLPSYDRASQFERIGADVIELNKRDWKRISTAATSE